MPNYCRKLAPYDESKEVHSTHPYATQIASVPNWYQKEDNWVDTTLKTKNSMKQAGAKLGQAQYKIG